MKKLPLLALAFTLLTLSALGCPDFGVVLKGLPGKLKVRASGNVIRVETPQKKVYSFFFDATEGDKGSWCYTTSENPAKEICGDFSPGSELEIADGAVAYGIVRTRNNEVPLAGTDRKGPGLAILTDEQPWLRFVYSYESEPGKEKINRREKVAEKLRAAGAKDGQDTPYKLRHEMYVDLFTNQELGNGVIDRPGILGTILIGKLEFPLRAEDRSPVKDGEADLMGHFWRTNENLPGCHVQLEEIEKARGKK